MTAPEDDRPVGEVPPTHPESYCHRCDGPNVSWWVPSPVWNLVMGYPEQIYDGIVCPLCFVALAEARGARGPWRVAPRVWPDDVALVHVDGRVWDQVAERWVDQVDANRESEEVEALREQVAHRDTLLDNAARLLADSTTDSRTWQALLTQLHEARVALQALGRERNTWARQMADLRDERDTAREAEAAARLDHGRLATGRDVAQVEANEARAWIAECMRIHQQWIDHHDEHADAGETCEHAEVAGDREHHVRCNERYEAVVAALGEVRP